MMIQCKASSASHVRIDPLAAMLTRLSEKVWQSDQADARRLCEDPSEAWMGEGFKAVICPAYNVRIPYHPRIAALLLPVWDDTEPRRQCTKQRHASIVISGPLSSTATEA